jgi:hypothetical protein
VWESFACVHGTNMHAAFDIIWANSSRGCVTKTLRHPTTAHARQSVQSATLSPEICGRI